MSYRYLSCARRQDSTHYLWEIMRSVSREPPSMIQEARNILRQVRSSSVPVKLCIDVGHACNPHAEDPRDRDPCTFLAERVRLSSLHAFTFSRQMVKGDRHWPFTDEFNKIGIIDGKKIISSLDKSGAGKTYIYPEVFPAFEQDDSQVIEDMTKTMKYWKEYL